MTTLRELIKGSMRLINVVGTNEEPSADDMELSLEAMNGLVESLGNDVLNIYTFQPRYFPLTPGKQSYTLGPAIDESGALTGADWVITRPMRIEQARLMRGASIQFGSLPEPPAGCNLVSSQTDDTVYELWHFDEGLGATSTTAAVWVDEDDFSRTLTFAGDPPTWSLQTGCCGTGLYLGNENTLTEHTLSPNAGGGFIGGLSLPDGFTIEFSLFNDGATDPGQFDYAEVFRSDLFTYGGGEGVSTIRGFKVGQELWIMKGADFETDVLVQLPLEVGTCSAICIEGAWDGSVSLYLNGVRAFNDLAANLWSFFSTTDNAGGFTVFSYVTSPSGLVIDEYRRSSGIRYDSATYEYTI